MSNLIAGRGINDAGYTIQKIKDGRYWHCPYYSAWVRAVRSGNPMSDEWIKFSEFRRWMSKRNWKGKVLDRWLYGDGFSYGPDKCCFLDRHSSNLARGLREKTSMGVDTPHGEGVNNPFRVTVIGKHIGYYATRAEARAAWCKEAHKELRKRSRNHKDAVDALYDSAKAIPA